MPARLDHVGAPYTVRVSRRAKHVRLRISPRGGLDVVVPHGFDMAEVPAILARKREWIERSLRRLREQAAIRSALTPQVRPDSIPLRAIGERWQVHYRDAAMPLAATECGRRELLLEGDLSSAEDCHTALRDWLLRKARKALPPWLRETSSELALPCGKVMVRNQKTRWGSCSSRNTISVNCKLIFLPTDLVRYLFVHELCHTRHLDHSSRFWDLVAQHAPEYRHLEAELNEAWRHVPLWAET